MNIDVGMARHFPRQSIFICFDGCGSTGQYTVWGQVENGMEAVGKLNGEPTDPDRIILAKLVD